MADRVQECWMWLSLTPWESSLVAPGPGPGKPPMFYPFLASLTSFSHEGLGREDIGLPWQQHPSASEPRASPSPSVGSAWASRSCPI